MKIIPFRSLIAEMGVRWGQICFVITRCDRGRRLFFLLTSWTLWEEPMGHVTLSAFFSAIWFSFSWKS